VKVGPVARLAYRAFGRLARRHPSLARLERDVARAHLPLRADLFLVVGYGASTATGVFMAILATATATAVGSAPEAAGMLGLGLGILVTLLGVAAVHRVPRILAEARSRSADAALPAALAYVAALAGAGVVPERIFAEVGREKAFGPVADECARIARDMRVLGLDLVSALSRAIDQSPSPRFADFLQGAVSTLGAGGSLREYLISKSEQIAAETRLEQRSFLDHLGLIAESYVTVVVAAPLFLIIMLSVMVSFGSAASASLTDGYLLVLVVVPLMQAAFAFTIHAVTPEDA